MQNPIFVFGVQRSGTTLLSNILSRHPELYIKNELPSKIYNYLTGELTDQSALLSYLKGYPKWAELSEIITDPYKYTPWELLEIALEKRMQLNNKIRWGIKEPGLTNYLSVFIERYPKGHFLLLYRDPRAVIASQIKRKFYIANAFHGARYWKKQIEIQLQFAEKYSNQVTVIKFEDFLQDPVSHLKSICDAIKVKYTKAMIDPSVKTEVKIHEYNKNIVQPVLTEVTEKWKMNLTNKQVKIIESITAENMHKFGYVFNCELSDITLIQKVFYDCHQVVMSNYWTSKRIGLKRLINGRFESMLKRIQIKSK